MNLEKIVRKNILSLKPYSSARSSHLDGILLDANENSLGSVVKNDLKLNRYPDPNQTEIRKSIAEYLNVDYKKIFIGVGSDEVIDLIVRIFCEPGKDEAVICEPTYGMYKVVCDINNVKSRIARLNAKFDIDSREIFQNINSKSKIIFMCSPNNPTGNLLSSKKIIEISKRFNGIIVVDQAYIDFADDKDSLSVLADLPNVIVLRTFSKAWGLAAVRCGFAIADRRIIEILFKVKSPYNLNKLTSDLILSAIKKIKIKDKFVARINREKQKMIATLKTYEKIKKIFKSDSNFILFKVENAKDVYLKLAARGIIIRDRSNQINLENCLRVSVGTPAENKLFLTELKKIL